MRGWFSHIQAERYQLTEPALQLPQDSIHHIGLRIATSANPWGAYLFEHSNKLIRDCVSRFLPIPQVLPCLYLLIVPYSSGWTAGSTSVCSRCPVWSACLYSTPCAWHTTWELLTRRPRNNSPSTRGWCPTWKPCGQSAFCTFERSVIMGVEQWYLQRVYSLSLCPPGCHSGSCLLKWIQGQRWRGSWGPSRIALDDTSWGRESSASTNIPPTSSLTWFVSQMFSNATFFHLWCIFSRKLLPGGCLSTITFSRALVRTTMLQEQILILGVIIVRTNLKNVTMWAFPDCIWNWT